MQVLDNAEHADGKNPVTSASSNYALIAPSKDYFSVPEDEISFLTSDLTVVGGRIVYGAGDFVSLDDNPLPPAMPEDSGIRVMVFDFQKWDSVANNWQVALRMATLDAIKMAGGKPLMSSGWMVRPEWLDADGFLRDEKALLAPRK